MSNILLEVVEMEPLECKCAFCKWEGFVRDLQTHIYSAHPEEIIDINEPIHEWFELSYSQYLTIPRSVLQSMPEEWQERFVKCLEELDETMDWRPHEGRYWVQLKDARGHFVKDPLMDYERGRRKITRRKNK